MKFIARALLLCFHLVLAQAPLLFTSHGFAADPAFDLAPIPVASATNAGSNSNPAPGSRPPTFALVQEAAERGDPDRASVLNK